MERVVVVGAGLAGGRTVVELREQGFTGQITLIGAEEHLPYDRPPLSKAVLVGRTDSTQLPYALNELDGVELLLGRRATGLEPGVVHTDAGPVNYDGLVLATGSAPIRLPGSDSQRLLRTIEEARALRETLRPGLRLVVVGVRPDVGWLGGTLAVERGVVVDEHLLATWAGDVAGTAGAAPVVAVGDCSAWWSARYGQRMHVEHWDAAQSAPTVAASTLLGLAAGTPVGELPTYNPVPYFWSEQFGRMVQFAGVPAAGASLVFRGDPTVRRTPDMKRAPGWAAGWFAPDGTLSALVTVARPIDMVAGRRLLAADVRPDQARFADVEVPLKSLLED